MTTATKITVTRILLIPVFVVFAIYYGESVKKGAPVEALRWAAISTFLVAAVSDAVDGYLARHFDQRSRLGAILDPLADKLLMLSALIVLSFAKWGTFFPIWYASLVITRDAILVIGALMMNQVLESVKVIPHWTGKLATVTQLVAVGWLMFQFPAVGLTVTIIIASIFTTISAVLYIRAGLRQVQESENV